MPKGGGVGWICTSLNTGITIIALHDLINISISKRDIFITKHLHRHPSLFTTITHQTTRSQNIYDYFFKYK